MTHADYVIGDIFEALAATPDASVDLVMTSPPFLAQRAYLPADHPHKAQEIGSERNPSEWLDVMLALTAEWRRVLAPHGSICVELGDTHAGSGGAGGDYEEGGLREGQPKFSQWATRTNHLYDTSNRYDENWNKGNTAGLPIEGVSLNAGPGWPLDKSLALVPESYRWALVYGRNPFTGEASPAGQWRARNVVRWFRTNPPVGMLGDKFRRGTTDMIIACTSTRRYFDLDAVREPGSTWGKKNQQDHGYARSSIDHSDVASNWLDQLGYVDHPLGAPPLDTWIIPTERYRGSHYATYPAALCVKPIASMCPQRVCVRCGEPSRRITRQTGEYARFRAQANAGHQQTTAWDAASGNRSKGLGGHENADSPARGQRYETLGWTECGCGEGCVATRWEAARAPMIDENTGEPLLTPSGRIRTRPSREVEEVGECKDPTHWRPGMVLDPFAGSGTTLSVATGHGRDALGIDLDERNAELAVSRIGPLMVTSWTLDDWRGAA